MPDSLSSSTAQRQRTASTQLVSESGVKLQSYPDARVLIVEDNALSRMTLARELEKWGIMPEFAVDGKHALYRLKNEDWDVVFMDVAMPRMDGLDVCRTFFESHPSSDLPIVAITATSSSELKEKAIECGMKGVIAKAHLAQATNLVLSKFLG